MSAQWTYRRMLPSFPELTDADIVETFLEYSKNVYPIQLTQVTVSIHTILYIRKIYPQELFQRVRKYNTPVFQCRHPEVCIWVNDAIQAIGQELKKAFPPRFTC